MTKTTQPPPNVGPESAPANPPAVPWEGLKPCRLPDRQSIDLVGLPALVQWHMSAKNLHFPQAADAVHQKLMERRDSLTLYVAQSNGEARAVDDSDCFGLDRKKVCGVISRGIDGIGGRSGVFSQRVRLPEGVSPGQSAALYIVGAWGNGRYLEAVMDVEGSNARLLAMPCEQAAALWGLSGTDDQTTEVTKDDSFLLLLEAYEKRGNMTREKFASDHDLNVATLKKRLLEARKLRKKKTTNPFIGLTVVDGKKVANR